MAIKIEHIRVNRGGPLGEDFKLTPGQLNLIYGRNESGKTYLVEAFIQLLYSKGKKSGEAWGLRQWDLKGRIEVSGLAEENVPFTKTSKKLEEYWAEEHGLPPDLARLLVVKGGDALLDPDAGDGVGDQLLRTYLSGEGLLDGIDSRISATIREASAQGQLIQGASRGELKKRHELLADRQRIFQLLGEVEERYASGEAHALRREIEALDRQRSGLVQARRHRAAMVFRDLQAQQRQQSRQPTPQQLSELSEKLAIYESKAVETEARAETLTDLEQSTDDFQWTRKALEMYREITSSDGGSGGGGTKPLYLLVALILLVAAVGAGLMAWKIPMAVCSVVAAGLVGFYYWTTKRSLARAGEGRELEQLTKEFHRRFGEKLSGRATLEARLARLQERHIQAGSLRNDLERGQTELRELETQIGVQLESFTGSRPEPDVWRHAVDELRAAVTNTAEEVASLERELQALGVPEDEYLAEDPGFEWSPAQVQELTTQHQSLQESLQEADTKLEQLRVRTLQELRRSDGAWEDLIEALRETHREAAEAYRVATAEILGKIQVATVIKEFREQENERITAGLTSDTVSAPLKALTGRYTGVRQDEDGQLVLLGEHDEFPLAMASTGTREQVYLALRIGFAARLMQGECGVLILDDAFQHSDWLRRENCVQALVGLVGAGWQVFYFTMDDHIRDLVTDAGRGMGERFTEVELG